MVVAVVQSAMSAWTGEAWNEIEPSVLVVVGFLLFVFPEPATSALGAGLMLFGVSWWFYEWGR